MISAPCLFELDDIVNPDSKTQPAAIRAGHDVIMNDSGKLTITACFSKINLIDCIENRINHQQRQMKNQAQDGR